MIAVERAEGPGTPRWGYVRYDTGARQGAGEDTEAMESATPVGGDTGYREDCRREAAFPREQKKH